MLLSHITTSFDWGFALLLQKSAFLLRHGPMPALYVDRQVFLHALAAAEAARALAVANLNLVGLADAVGAPIQAVCIGADNRGHEKDLLSGMKKAAQATFVASTAWFDNFIGLIILQLLQNYQFDFFHMAQRDDLK